MADIDFEAFVAQLAEDRDPLVLEEIVCLYANDNDTEALEKLKESEDRLHAELMSMKSETSGANFWSDVSAAIDLCVRQKRLIDQALTDIRRPK